MTHVVERRAPALEQGPAGGMRDDWPGGIDGPAASSARLRGAAISGGGRFRGRRQTSGRPTFKLHLGRNKAGNNAYVWRPACPTCFRGSAAKRAGRIGGCTLWGLLRVRKCRRRRRRAPVPTADTGATGPTGPLEPEARMGGACAPTRKRSAEKGDQPGAIR